MPINNFQNLPQGWEVKTLGEVCELCNGYAFQSSSFTDKGVPVVRIGDIQNFEVDTNHSLRVEKSQEYENYKIQRGDLLIAMSGATTGKIGIYKLNNSAYLNQRVGNLKIKSNAILAAYRNFALYALQDEIYKRAYGGAQPNISKGAIESLKIPLPPLEVQKAIVEKLENAFTHIDEAVRHLKAVQTNIPRLKSSLLHCAFSGKLTESDFKDSIAKPQAYDIMDLRGAGEFANANARHELRFVSRNDAVADALASRHCEKRNEVRDEAIHNVESLPQDWEVKTLGEVFKVIGGGTPSTTNPKFWSGNIAWITSANIENESFTIIPRKFINQNAIQASATNLVPKNTIIVVTRVGLGKVGITDVETCFSQDSQALLPLTDLNVKFMAFQIKNEAQNFIVSSRGTTINGITKDTLKKVVLKIPPLATQNQIVQILESKFAHLEKLAQFVNTSLENLQRLKSSLLNQAFKGELVC